MKNNNRSLIELFKKLKIAPNSYFLYIEALTHSSYHNDNHLDYDYERLEFLGDQVISFVVCEYLYNKNPKLSVGQMSKDKIVIVQAKSEVIAANKLSIIAQTGNAEYLSVVEQNPVLSNIKVTTLNNTPGLEVYNVSIWGEDIPMTKADATKFTVAIEQYQQIKNYHKAGGQANERMENALVKICKDIAETTGYSIESVATQLGNDIEE